MCFKLRGCFSVLRPEFFITKAHANPYVQEIREALWAETRLQTCPLGSQLIKKLGGRRRGQQETW